MSRNIQVTIDSLILRGVDAGDRRHMVEAIRGELSRMLTEPAMRATLARTQRVPVLRLGRMPFAPGATGSRTLGQGIVRAVGKRMMP
jgi:hypothetical protein